MRMLHMICGKTLRDDISNKTICEMTDVEKIEEFLREQKLRWFEHTEKIDDERAPVKEKCIDLINGSKRGRFKKRWKEAIEKDTLARGLRRSDAQDHAVWRLGCKNLST